MLQARLEPLLVAVPSAGTPPPALAQWPLVAHGCEQASLHSILDEGGAPEGPMLRLSAELPPSEGGRHRQRAHRQPFARLFMRATVTVRAAMAAGPVPSHDGPGPSFDASGYAAAAAART